MTMPSKTAPYTLTAAGCDWTFTAEAWAALNDAGFAPHLLAVIVKPSTGLTEINLEGVGVFLVNREGKKITVRKAKEESDPRPQPAGD
jgi:hypothetical protein